MTPNNETTQLRREKLISPQNQLTVGLQTSIFYFLIFLKVLTGITYDKKQFILR